MSSSYYGYGEEPENPSRAELAERAKKRYEPQYTNNWRDTNRIEDPDSTFKIIAAIQRQARNDSLKKPLTQQQISDRVARQEIIQQAVKNGTYDDPAKPWNKKSRWIEDGGHEY